MPNKPAARKALRQTKKHAIANKILRERFRDLVKKAQKSTVVEEAKKLARDAQQALDKAAKNGVIKKNTAARKLSRLMAKVNNMEKK